MKPVFIPEIDVHPNNYRKHVQSNITGNRIDSDGHRLISCEEKNANSNAIYIFGGSVGFGYKLADNETWFYHLAQLTGASIINLSKICNDITNLYYMVLSEKPSNSIVILDTGVCIEFQRFFLL